MSRPKKGEGRGLEPFEVALIKRMTDEQFPRDRIMSFFVRPNRIISPAAISEIKAGKIGVDISPASKSELSNYIEKRVNEPPPSTNIVYSSPISPFTVRNRLTDWLKPQLTFENSDIEIKERLPENKDGVAKIIRAIASFANASGGYIYFGVANGRKVTGIDNGEKEQRILRSIGDKCRELICPSVIFDRIYFELDGYLLAAIYVAPSASKPVVIMADYTPELNAGDIYFRYSGQSSRITPGDLLRLLSERDLALVGRLNG